MSNPCYRRAIQNFGHTQIWFKDTRYRFDPARLGTNILKYRQLFRKLDKKQEWS
jgi:hypothetical protein